MTKTTTARDYRLDNLKGFAILLVVFGHFIQPCIKESDLLRNIFFSIYTIHMPLFCLVSGYLFKRSRSDTWTKLKRYLLYFAAGQLAYTAICLAFGADPVYYSLLWYLIALMAWAVVTPWLTRHGVKLPLLISMVLGLGIGLLPTEGFSILSPRIITYYPYFLLGVFLDKPYTLGNAKKMIFGLLFVGVLGICLTQLDLINYRAVFLNQDYLDMDMTYTLGLSTRLALYILGFIAALGCFYTFTSQLTLFTELGRISAIIYLAHGVLIKTLMLLLPDAMTNPTVNIGITGITISLLLLLSFRRFHFEKATH